MPVRYVRIALLVAMATILSVIETTIPNPMPWIRLGLANLATILALKWWGIREASFIVILRVLLSSLIIGRIFQVTFWLSLSGGIAATLGMWIVLKYGHKIFSLIGISIFGALCHNIGQIVIAYLFFIRHHGIFSFLPILFLSSIITGLMIGLIAHILHERLKLLIH